MQRRGAALVSTFAGLSLLLLACATPPPVAVAAPPAPSAEEAEDDEKEAASGEDDEEEEAGEGKPKAPDKPPPPISTGRGDGGVTVLPTASPPNVRLACQRLWVALAATRNRQVQQGILGAMVELGCAASPGARMVPGPGHGTRDHRR